MVLQHYGSEPHGHVDQALVDVRRLNGVGLCASLIFVFGIVPVVALRCGSERQENLSENLEGVGLWRKEKKGDSGWV